MKVTSIRHITLSPGKFNSLNAELFRKSGGIIITAQLIFVICFFNLLFFQTANATTYYSRQSGLNWSNPAAWSTVTYGNPVNLGTIPKAGDNVYVGAGHTVILDNGQNCSSLTIGQTGNGTVLFTTLRIVNLRISTNLNIGAGGNLIYNGNASRTHWVYIGKDLQNNGNISVYTDPNDHVEFVFNSSNNTTITGNGSYVLNRVTMLKTGIVSNVMNVLSTTFEAGVQELIVTDGYYIHNNTSSYVVNPGTFNFTLTKDVTIEVPMGSMHFAPTSNFMYLNGTLLLTGGTVKVGSTSGNQGFRYEQVGLMIPRLIINSGTMEVYGGLIYRAVTPTSAFYFEMNGGQLLLNTGSFGSRNGVFNIVDNPLSSFKFTGGTITLAKPNRDYLTYPDFELCGTTGLVNATTGGIVEFGYSTTANSTFTFKPSPTAVYPNIRVTGPVASNIKLCPFYNNTDNVQFNSLYLDPGKTFDVNANVTNNGGARSVLLAGNYDGMHTFYNDGIFTPRNSTVIIQGTEGLWLGGTNTTSFYKLTINNFFGVSLGSSINIQNQLLLTDGIVYVNPPYRLTCMANGRATIGNANSYIDGFFDQMIASTAAQSFNIPIGRNNAYRPMVMNVRHSTTGMATYSTEVVNLSPRSFNYTLPPTLSLVSNVRYYQMNRTGASNFNRASVTLSYGPDDGVTDYTQLRVAQYGGSSNWVDHGGSGSANTSGTITSNSFNTFNGMFTLANSTLGTNPLPISLLEFNATAVNETVQLNWSTASEENASHFEIESSPDADHFLTLGSVLAHGNTMEPMHYTFTDDNPSDGNTYYRLKMVDLDGSFEYSPVRVANFRKMHIINIWPNPSYQTDIRITKPEDFSGPVELFVYTMDNKMIYTNKTDFDQITIPSAILSQGNYTILLKAREEMVYGKLVII